MLLLAMATTIAPRAAPTVAEADAAFAAEDWSAAARAYRKLAKSKDADGRTWFRLGRAEHNQGAFARALEAFAAADAAGFYPQPTRYNAACAAARAGDLDAAFSWLERALDVGFGSPEQLDQDEDLAALRADPRMAALRERADRNARPCRYDERYRAFDFWVGDWDVYQGAVLAGRNVVTSIQEGCAVLEQWTSTLGDTGTSLNWIDPRDGSWHQSWVDTSGRVIVPLAGGMVEGRMALSGVTVTLDGATESWRGTWTPNEDGTVRQLLERSADGEQWRVGFDGLYVPHGAPPPAP